MSIGVRIPLEGAEQEFPLASSEIFKRFWLPGAVALNLQWVKQFDACQLRPDNLIPITSELRQLREWFYQTQPPDTARALAERIDRVLPALESLKDAKNFSIWIG
jgi:hypothetical protein